MKKQSAGLLLYRQIEGEYQILLAHPGGPYWAKKDVAAWSIPKGEIEPGEDPLAAARREFAEEMGAPVPSGTPQPLGVFAQSGSKVVHAWALAADFDLQVFKSHTITIEWPPKTGQQLEVPENDKAAWMRLPEAQLKLFAYQVPILDALCDLLGIAADPPHIVPFETITSTVPTPQSKAPKQSPPPAPGSLAQTSLF